MKVRRLTQTGRELYLSWLEGRAPGELPPGELIDGPEATELVLDVDIDPSRDFLNRYDFGEYMVQALGESNCKPLLNATNDGVWDWLTVVYFGQFGRKMSRPWHYSVMRKGHSGSLAYRHIARTSFEMYWRHRAASVVMLHVDLATWGDLSEQLTSRQNVAHHQGYIEAAHALYFPDGALVKGAASRVRPIKKRKPGEQRGKGSVARLAVAVRRLCRTYDTHMLTTTEMLSVLPREFSSFAEKSRVVTRGRPGTRA